MPLHDLEGRSTYNHKGYVTVRYPDHPRSWKGTGQVYLHRLVMENHLGRILDPSEHVHHKDGDPLNNYIENLEVVTPQDHLDHHRRDHTHPPKYGMIPCKVCGALFKEKTRHKHCCSPKCRAVRARRAEWPTKEELKKLVWEVPTSQLAERFGVSDVAVAKWCKKYGIEKPPRGYWAGR